MNEFQLDHGDVDDILAVVAREGNLPVYLFHAQVMDRAEPPTVRFVGLGLWWTDLFSMSEQYLGSRRRPLETKMAAYYNTGMFVSQQTSLSTLSLVDQRVSAHV